MALFFSCEILEAQAGGDSVKFMAMLEFHWNKKLPKNSYTKVLPSKVSLAGYSYLLNPSDLFSDKSTDILYRIQYVKLAALRDYNLYKQYKYKALQTSYYPDINYKAIKHNPLLTITPSEISFNYE